MKAVVVDVSEPGDEVMVVVATTVTVKDLRRDKMFVVSSLGSGTGLLPDESTEEAILEVADKVAKQCTEQALVQGFIKEGNYR